MIKVNGKEISFSQFPNNETIVDGKQIREAIESVYPKSMFESHIIDFKYEDDKDLVRLMFVKKHLDDNGYRGIELRIHYMPYSRMDRVEDGSVFTLKHVAHFINYLKFRHVVVIEPHSDVTPAVLDNVRVEYLNKSKNLAKVMSAVNFDREKDYLMLPDAGASKRYKDLTGFNIVEGSKVRDFGTGEIISFEVHGDIEEGAKVIIVDDLCSKGGTFLGSAQALREKGAGDIFLLVTHCEETIFEGDILYTDLIKHVYTTDTLLEMHPDMYSDKITIIAVEQVDINDPRCVSPF